MTALWVVGGTVGGWVGGTLPGHPTVLGEHALGALHAMHVFRRGFLADEEDLLAVLGHGLGLVGGKDEGAGTHAGGRGKTVFG